MHARTADKADIPEVLEMCQKFWSSLSYSKHIPFDQRTALATLRDMLDRQLLVVAEHDLELAGMLGGAISPSFVNREYTVGSEFFFWVRPEFRSRGAARLMLHAIEDRARELGCTWWSMMAIEKMEAEAIGAMYEREGYVWTERSYLKVL